MNRLNGNADHFLVEAQRVGYIISRISNKASRYISYRIAYESTNPYLVVKDIIDDLTPVFEDFNKLRNYRREYKELN